MARTTVQSTFVPLQMSFDGGTTWKDVVCLKQYNSPLTNSTNDSESFCGKHVGQGTKAMDFSGEAIYDLTPGATEVSLEDLEVAMMAGATPLARMVYPGTGSVGNLLWRKSEVVIESTNVKLVTNDFITFDFSLKGQGIPEVTKP